MKVTISLNYQGTAITLWDYTTGSLFLDRGACVDGFYRAFSPQLDRTRKHIDIRSKNPKKKGFKKTLISTEEMDAQEKFFLKTNGFSLLGKNFVCWIKYL